MLVQSFLEYLKSERNSSIRTVENYAKDLSLFREFFESFDEGITWESVDASMIREWIVYQLDEEKVSSATVNRRLSALRTFYHYLMRVEKVAVNPTLKITGPKKAKVLPSFVKENEMNKLLEEMALDDSFTGQRDRLVILMFYMTGVRLAELIGLREADVDFFAKYVKVTGKRNKQRLIPFGDELEKAMKDYLALKHEEVADADDAFFVDTKGTPLRRDQVGTIVKSNLSKVTSISKRSPHVLRHTFATLMLNNDADLASIQKLLGHASLKTTEVYTHLSFEELKNTYKNAHPRS